MKLVDSSFLDLVPAAVVILDDASIIRGANRRLGDLVGFAPHQLVGTTAATIVRAEVALDEADPSLIRLEICGRTLGVRTARAVVDQGSAMTVCIEQSAQPANGAWLQILCDASSAPMAIIEGQEIHYSNQAFRNLLDAAEGDAAADGRSISISLQPNGDLSREAEASTGFEAGGELGSCRPEVGSLERAVSVLTAAVEASADAIVVLDQNQSVLMFNRCFSELWQIPPDLPSEEIVQAMFAQVEDRERLRSIVSSAAGAVGKPSEIILSDGRLFECSSHLQLEQGSVTGKVLSFRDVTERSHTNEALGRRDAILHAVGFAAERFLTPEDWHLSMNEVLQQLGRAASVSRVYAFEIHPDEHGEPRWSQRYEWVAAGVTPEIENPELQMLPVTGTFAAWQEVLETGQSVTAHLEQMGQDIQPLMRSQGIRSLVLVPIPVKRALWGFIGFDECLRERDWTFAEVEALKTAARTLGGAIDRLRAEEALRDSERRYRLLFERNLAGVFRTNLQGEFIDCNDACARILGYESRDELLAEGDAVSHYFDPHQRTEFLQELTTQRSISNLELCFRRRDGQPIWVLENVTITDDENRRQVIEGTIIDITDRKKAEEQIRHQAYHDPLTGLPNRMLFGDRLAMTLARARRAGRSFAVMFLDLDHFKSVNDTWGHAAGDELLRQVADRIRSCVREEDTVARLGGDEFTLLLFDLKSDESIQKVADKLRGSLEEPFIVAGGEVSITTSVGVARFPDDGRDFDTLLKVADGAMYRAKSAGRNTVKIGVE